MDLRLHAPRPDVVVVRVSGPVDGLAAGLLADRVGQQLHRAPHVVVDLGRVSVLGAGCVAVLSALPAQVLARGTQLHIVGAHDAIRRPLHAAGLARLLRPEPTADAVIAALPGPVCSGVGAGRIGLNPDDENPSGDQGPKPAGPLAGSADRTADAISPDPAAGRSNGTQAGRPRRPLDQCESTNPTGTACLQHWQDAQLALDVARRCFEAWRQAGGDQTAIRHARHTHEALHEASRAIAVLMEAFRVAVVTGPAR
jgi:anti-anti-sigma factor